MEMNAIKAAIDEDRQRLMAAGICCDNPTEVSLCVFHVLQAWEEHLFPRFADNGLRDELRVAIRRILWCKVREAIVSMLVLSPSRCPAD